MLVNQKKTERHVEFVSYSGAESNLCRGRLVLRIDGKEYVFSLDDGDLPKFWASGGEYGFGGGNYTNPYIHHSEWIIDASELPNELQQYAQEIDEVFNANVNHGCGGGCL